MKIMPYTPAKNQYNSSNKKSPIKQQQVTLTDKSSNINFCGLENSLVELQHKFAKVLEIKSNKPKISEIFANKYKGAIISDSIFQELEFKARLGFLFSESVSITETKILDYLFANDRYFQKSFTIKNCEIGRKSSSENNLHDIGVRGEFRLENNVIHSQFNSASSKFEGPFILKDNTFYQDVNYNCAKFSGPVNIEDNKFYENLNLRYSEFFEQVNIDHNRFKTLNLKGTEEKTTKFYKEFNLTNCEIDSVTNFVNMDFYKPASFQNTVFKSRVVFDNTKFREGADFSGVVFEDCAYLNKLNLSNVNLKGAIYKRKDSIELPQGVTVESLGMISWEEAQKLSQKMAQYERKQGSLPPFETFIKGLDLTDDDITAAQNLYKTFELQLQQVRTEKALDGTNLENVLERIKNATQTALKEITLPENKG